MINSNDNNNDINEVYTFVENEDKIIKTIMKISENQSVTIRNHSSTILNLSTLLASGELTNMTICILFVNIIPQNSMLI